VNRETQIGAGTRHTVSITTVPGSFSVHHLVILTPPQTEPTILTHKLTTTPLEFISGSLRKFSPENLYLWPAAGDVPFKKIATHY